VGITLDIHSNIFTLCITLLDGISRCDTFIHEADNIRNMRDDIATELSTGEREETELVEPDDYSEGDDNK